MEIIDPIKKGAVAKSKLLAYESRKERERRRKHKLKDEKGRA